MGIRLVVDTRGLDVGCVPGTAGGDSINHVAFGAGAFEERHGKGVVAIGAFDFQRHGHLLFVETHHTDFVGNTFAIQGGSFASIVHCISLLSVTKNYKVDKFDLFR